MTITISNNTNTTTIGSEVRCSGRISSLYSICGTHRATLIANLVIQCMSWMRKGLWLRQTEHIHAHLSVVNRVHVTQSLVFYVVFRRLLFVLFLLENWFVCYSIYDFWLSPFAIFKLVLVTLFRPNRSHIRYLFYCSNVWRYRYCINVILWIKC
jgi:hypothetical protein